MMPSLVTNPAPLATIKAKLNSGSVMSFSVRPTTDESLADLCHRLTRQLHAHEATPLHLLVFGNRQASAATLTALQTSLGNRDWPMTWVEGSACNNHPLAGIQVHAFSGTVERLRLDGRIVGSVFTEGEARQCLIGDLASTDPTLSHAAQTQSVLADLENVLASAGFDLGDTVRTWFFLDNILAWYDDFNQARTKIYSGIKFRTGSLPASTGVGARNLAGTALALAAWAFRPIDQKPHATEIASPLQCPAPAYGSSFSRAMALSTAAGRRLFISGTASIAPGGKTLWVDDVRKQVELTMDVVEAILRSRGFTLADLCHATAYFRHANDMKVFTEWLVANRMEQMPVINAQCDVCRNDLLFELEAEVESPI